MAVLACKILSQFGVTISGTYPRSAPERIYRETSRRGPIRACIRTGGPNTSKQAHAARDARAGHLVPFRRQPLRSVEFAVGPFGVIRHACCLRARGSNEYSFHGYFAVRKPGRRGRANKTGVADPLQIDHAPLGRGVALDVALCNACPIRGAESSSTLGASLGGSTSFGIPSATPGC
jgi:hypothetical protein